MRITRVYLDVDMRQNFEGLRKVSAKDKLDKPGSMVLFINRKKTSFKILNEDKYVIYYKNGNKRIPIDALALLPQNFGGTEFEMNEAIKKSLESKGINK